MTTKIKNSSRVYFHYITISLRSAMQYRVSFFLMVTGRFLVAFNGILGVYFMFSRFGHVKGYTFGEVLLCFSVIQMDFALAECIGGGFAMFSGIVRPHAVKNARIFSSSSPSKRSVSPKARATVSFVRSSSVGPRPPEKTNRSLRERASRTTLSSRAGLSPTTV